jgi:hypothetical protein
MLAFYAVSQTKEKLIRVSKISPTQNQPEKIKTLASKTYSLLISFPSFIS